MGLPLAPRQLGDGELARRIAEQAAALARQLERDRAALDAAGHRDLADTVSQVTEPLRHLAKVAAETEHEKQDA